MVTPKKIVKVSNRALGEISESVRWVNLYLKNGVVTILSPEGHSSRYIANTKVNTDVGVARIGVLRIETSVKLEQA